MILEAWKKKICQKLSIYHEPSDLRAPEDFMKRECNHLDISAMRVAY